MAQIKIRMKDRLRGMIEDAANENDHSMNAEMVRRLDESFRSDRVVGMLSQMMVALGVGVEGKVSQPVFSFEVTNDGFIGSPYLRTYCELPDGRKAASFKPLEPMLTLGTRGIDGEALVGVAEALERVAALCRQRSKSPSSQSNVDA